MYSQQVTSLTLQSVSPRDHAGVGLETTSVDPGADLVCRQVLAPGGQVHVSLKLQPPYSQWGAHEQAKAAGFVHSDTLVFEPSAFPGYRHATTKEDAKTLDVRSKGAVHSLKTLVFRRSAAAAAAAAAALTAGTSPTGRKFMWQCADKNSSFCAHVATYRSAGRCILLQSGPLPPLQ